MQLKHYIKLAGFCLASTVAGPGHAQTAPVPPTTIGINLSSVGWASGQRAFANLAIGLPWTLSGGKAPPAADVTRDGGIAYVPPGNNGTYYLTPPDAPNGVTVNCTWQGTAAVRLQSGGTVTNLTQTSNSLRFTWTNNWTANPAAWINVSSVRPGAPFDHLDCRETTMPADAVFDPAFVQSLAGFKQIRFMDWQQTNQGHVVSWAARNLPTTIALDGNDGVPVEDMMALVNAVGADPWFCMTWNESSDYIQHFAQYVHDNLPANAHVYVEESNEVWNVQFPSAKAAISHGLAEGLSKNPQLAGLYRYAISTVSVMRIWSQVFADRPGSLIRVISTQQVNPATADAVLGYKDTATYIDALATTAYFGYDLMSAGQTTDSALLFSRLSNSVDTTIAQDLQNQAIANKYGKSYVIYESGQSILIPYNMPLLTSLERDPRMGDIYTQFLSSWKTQIGGTLNLFANVGPIKTSGAWGMLEHSGQALADAPKMQAVAQQLGQ